MRCHYVYDKQAGKVLIPGCWGVAIHYTDKQPMFWCSCTDFPETFKEFERKTYNERVAELRREIKSLEKENARMNRVMKKLLTRHKE